MKWVTRRRVHVNRAATAWLIRRFLDPAAKILFVVERAAFLYDSLYAHLRRPTG